MTLMSSALVSLLLHNIKVVGTHLLRENKLFSHVSSEPTYCAHTEGKA